MENEQKKQSNYLGQLFGAVILLIFFALIFVPNLGEEAIEWVQKNRLTTFFGSILTVIFLLSSVNWLPSIHHKAAERLKDLPSPTLFLLIGIGGTFLGIWLGLRDFDVNNIKGSISELIDGLTIAFTTSITGIFYTIFYRAFVALFGVTQKQEIGAAEVIESIDKMAKKLDGFIDNLTDRVGQGLTDALQDLVTRLDQVITSQLGEAFKQLNESIKKLNDWVIAYKEQVETLTAAYKDNLIGIEAYNAKAKEIVQTLEPLQEYIRQIETAIGKISEPTRAFADLAEDARNAFPIIKENLDNITTEFANLA
ncbi:MAG: hypothetical protein OXU76_01305, partial [Alphaproteobacteria bacterium]|nr:hypothetical protein [Alphaproteobacteria bacterium]